MVKHFILWIIAAFICMDMHAQIQGCTDPQATNFNAGASINNGSCVYTNQNYSPQLIANLPASLVEWSGMVYWNGLFWGHNDGGNGAFLYAVDTATAAIRKVIKFTGITNVDWEDIAQDSLHFYIGDFGNNANGNRKNLKVYKFPKNYVKAEGDTILIGSDSIGIINFAYSDQTNFTATGANKTRYDCEAMFFHRDSLHLFTKNWIGNHSVHYTLPSIPGTWIATRQDSLNTGEYVITGADIGAEDQFMLSAYNRIPIALGATQLFLVYGFDSTVFYFNIGNKRTFQVPGGATQIGQLEAICFINGIRGVIGSERFSQSIFDITQNIRKFTTNQWITDHYEHNVLPVPEPGSLRYNSETDRFEYFDGKIWKVINQQ